MSTLHDSLINLRNALGYPQEEGGTCALYSSMAVNAFLVGELNVFYQRCVYIKKQMKTPAFLNLIKKVRTTSYVAVKKSASPEELQALPALLDIMAFIESGELYQYPHHYRRVFDTPLTEKKYFSALVQSKKLEQRKGRVLAKSVIGVYTFEELKDYIKLLNQLAGNAQQDFALNLGSDDHDIGLAYSHATKSWQLFDVNSPALQPISAENFDWEGRLASQIKEAFDDTTHIAFQTEIWTTGLLASGFQEHIKTFSDDSKFKQLHDIASHTTRTNARDASLATLSARAGDMETLRLCLEAKAQNGSYALDLNKAQSDGVTPMIVAAFNKDVEVLRLLAGARDEKGNFRDDLNCSLPTGETPTFLAAENNCVEALQLLIAAKNSNGTPRADLNRTNNAGMTPIFIAAQNGCVEALQLLIAAKNSNGTSRADLNRANNAGMTPVFMAAKQGHRAVIVELIKNNVDVESPFKCSVVELNKLVEDFNSEVVQRANVFTRNKADNDEVHLEPRDIAWILGYNEIVNLLEQKRLAKQMQETTKVPFSVVTLQSVGMDTSDEGRRSESHSRGQKRKNPADREDSHSEADNSTSAGFFSGPLSPPHKKQKTTQDAPLVSSMKSGDVPGVLYMG